ncbi:MAG: hypothetical protein WA418_23915 [Bradyrhizobium sp.]
MASQLWERGARMFIGRIADFADVASGFGVQMVVSGAGLAAQSRAEMHLLSADISRRAGVPHGLAGRCERSNARTFPTNEVGTNAGLAVSGGKGDHVLETTKEEPARAPGARPAVGRVGEVREKRVNIAGFASGRRPHRDFVEVHSALLPDLSWSEPSR